VEGDGVFDVAGWGSVAAGGVAAGAAFGGVGAGASGSVVDAAAEFMPGVFDCLL